MCSLTAWFRRCLVAAVVVLAPQAARAEWRPLPVQRLDVQLTAPYDFARLTDVIVLELFGTPPERVQQLRDRGVAVVCRVAAGLWENWRPDARSYPEAALGHSPTGWPGERLVDIREPNLRPILERRLDLCRAKGFVGVLLTYADGYARTTGFPITANDQLAFNRWLAEAARARSLAVGLENDLAQTAQLVDAFDFLVSDDCIAAEDCAGVQPFLTVNKPVQLLAYTNVPHRMDAYCAAAARIGAPLIFKI